MARRRRASFDDSGNLLNSQPAPTAGEATLDATAAPEDYGTLFLSSLPYDLRVEALLSADEAFIATLPAAIQAEARQLHQERSVHAGGGGGLFRLVGWDEGHDRGAVPTREDLSIAPSRRRSTNVSAATASSSSSCERALENACVHLEDDVTPMRHVPFGRNLPSRLLLHLYTTRRARLSRPLLRLMVSVCKYSVARKPIMRAVMSLLVSDQNGLVSSLEALQQRDSLVVGATACPSLPSTSEAYSGVSLSRDASALVNASQMGTATPVTLRRLLNAMYYLCKKTDNLCWYDLMSQSCGGDSECRRCCPNHSKWMFGQLLTLLGHPGFASNANIDMVLHVMQDILEPLSGLSIATVNALVARQGGLPSPVPNHTPHPSAVEENRAKRVRIDPVAITMPLESTQCDGSGESDDVSGQQVVGIISSSSRVPYKASTVGSLLRIKCDTPFPVIDDACAAMLTDVVHYEECGGVFPSRLGRILTTLSLHDDNWMRLLDCLRSVAEGVAVQTIAEARDIQQILTRIIDMNGDAAVALTLPHLSTPSTVSELRLLHVLRLITSLRTATREGDDTPSVTPIVKEVSDTIRKIDFQDLWDVMLAVLELVRRIEGLREQEILEDESMSAVAVEPTAIPTLSSLTMRFVPLIECFLTVCGSCVLRIPDGTKGDALPEEPGCSKRKGAPSDDTVGDIASGGEGKGLFSTCMQMPGSRFRRHEEFKRMQQELDDSADSKRLLQLVQSNSVLLNMVLKQNVNLLESSFAPLIQIPRCRALLHFDIKRAFFKMRLKRMKRSSRYQDGSAKLKV